MKRREKKNNKEFSLVELIVVIAIMIVLVAVLAPVFTKYVEQSRRATDVTNANTIAEAILVEAADKNLEAQSTPVKVESASIDALKSVPAVKGDAVKNGEFYYTYDKNANKVAVYVGNDNNPTASTDLTQEGSESEKTGAAYYKTAPSAQ